MRKIRDLGDRHLDLLKEIGNIGASHAATSLSQLLNRRIELKIPSVRIVPFAEMNDSHAEQHVAAAYIRVDGGVSGHFFMIFPVALANSLVAELVPNGTVFDQGMGESAFCEIGNILCGSYLTALAEFLHVQINQSPPVLAIDMEGAILGEGLIELSLDNDAAIMIDTVIVDKDSRHEIKGEFIFLPVPESMDVIFHMAEGKS